MSKIMTASEWLQMNGRNADRLNVFELTLCMDDYVAYATKHLQSEVERLKALAVKTERKRLSRICVHAKIVDEFIADFKKENNL